MYKCFIRTSRYCKLKEILCFMASGIVSGRLVSALVSRLVVRRMSRLAVGGDDVGVEIVGFPMSVPL